MSILPRISGTRGVLLFVLIFLFFTDLAIFLDIPVLRQCLGFLFFTIVPGLLILCILKLNKLDFVDKIVLSVGISVPFLIFAGLLINWIYFSLGYATPLSTTPLIATFSIFVIILGVIAYKINKDFSFRPFSFKLDTTEKACLLLPVFFPILAILGMRLMNTTSSNVMLMTLLFLIPAYLILIVALNGRVSKRVYPFIIFSSGISLLLLMALRSNHIIGVDTHTEYNLFQLISNEQHWRIFGHTSLDVCLSITLLPTIYQAILNINAEYLFKILYPLLFSISPLVVYIICKKYIGDSYGFIASFFLMSQQAFLWTTANARTSIAILFFALAIMVLSHDNINRFNKRLLFIVFIVSTVISHYSSAYIFLFVIFLTWLVMLVSSKITLRRKKPPALPENTLAIGDTTPTSLEEQPSLRSNVKALESPQFRREAITGTIIAMFMLILFCWYGQLTGVAFTSAILFFQDTFRNLGSFFVLESRGAEIVTLAGQGILQQKFPQFIEFIFSWLTIAFTVVGILITLIKRGRIVSILNSRHKKSDFPKNIDMEFLALSLACGLVLAVSVLLPRILVIYSMQRTYLQMIAVLSPFFVIGGITISKYLRLRPQWVILVVLIPFFMCTTGTMTQIFGAPRAMILNSEGPQYGSLYVHDQESYAIRWLRDYRETENMGVYADTYGCFRVLSQGGFVANYDRSFFEDKQPIKAGYFFLRYSNVIDGTLTDINNRSHDIEEYQDRFAGQNKVYSNGGSEILKTR